MPGAEPSPAGRRLLVGAVPEVALLGSCFGLYELGRYLAKGQQATARQHATLVHHAQAFLHLPDEAAIQAAIGWPWVFRVADTYYVLTHWAMIVVFLGWGYFRRPWAEYRWARNLLALQTGLALAGHLAFPLAPPRMFPQWGFVDTMTTYGPSAYGGSGGSPDPSGGFTNQFAAMPSLHVGWAVLVFYVVASTGPRLVGVLAGIYAATTLTVVVITANHWWLDTFVGIALLVVADLALRRQRPAVTAPD